jgi:hypothetical protein
MTISNNDRARLLPAVALTTLPAVLVWATGRLWRGRLPDPLPIHWNIAGRVDNTAALGATLTSLVALTVAAALVALVVVLSPGPSWRLRRAVVVVSASVAGLGAAVWLSTVALALDATVAAAVPGPTWHIAALIGGTALWTVIVALACGTAPPHPAASGRPPAGLARLDLRPGQRAAWTETVPMPRVAYLALLPLPAVALVLAFAGGFWAAAPLLLLAAALVLVVLRARFSVGAGGVTIGFGPLAWPRVRVPMREIASAAPATVHVAEWGGWGYRSSLDGRGRGLIMRGGPAVRLELSTGRYLVATVRDPETVAGLVNSLVDTSRPA